MGPYIVKVHLTIIGCKGFFNIYSRIGYPLERGPSHSPFWTLTLKGRPPDVSGMLGPLGLKKVVVDIVWGERRYMTAYCIFVESNLECSWLLYRCCICVHVFMYINVCMCKTILVKF